MMKPIQQWESHDISAIDYHNVFYFRLLNSIAIMCTVTLCEFALLLCHNSVLTAGHLSFPSSHSFCCLACATLAFL